MFELYWGHEILEGMAMSETIVVAGKWCEFVPVMDSWMIVGGIGYHLTPDGEWSADTPNSEDFHPTEAAAREFAKRHLEFIGATSRSVTMNENANQPRRAGRYSDEPAPEAERDIREGCGCRTCDPNDFMAGKCRMHLCESCGNKRCPHAEWHGYVCTGSNASGQVPTLVGHAPDARDPSGEPLTVSHPLTDAIYTSGLVSQEVAEKLAVRLVERGHWRPLGDAFRKAADIEADFCNLGEDKFAACVRLVESYADLRAEVERMTKERDQWKQAQEGTENQFRQERCILAERVRDLTAKLAAAERERDGWKHTYEALLTQAHKDSLKAEEAERLEEMLLDIAKTFGSDQINDALPSHISQYVSNLEDELEDAARERDALREALTASGDTKAEYIGEFVFNVERTDYDGNEYCESVSVPWPTVKEIMAAITNRAVKRLADAVGEVPDAN